MRHVAGVQALQEIACHFHLARGHARPDGGSDGAPVRGGDGHEVVHYGRAAELLDEITRDQAALAVAHEINFFRAGFRAHVHGEIHQLARALRDVPHGGIGN